MSLILKLSKRVFPHIVVWMLGLSCTEAQSQFEVPAFWSIDNVYDNHAVCFRIRYYLSDLG